MYKAIATFFLIISVISFSLSQNRNTLLFPVFSILKIDSVSYFTNKDLKDSSNTIFINFSPTCDHCERTIKSILQNIQKIPQTQFVLTSFDSLSSIRKFYLENGLNSFLNVFIGQEVEYSLTKQIKYSSFPCLVLFDKNNNYIKTIDEESNAKVIMKILKIKSR